VKILFYGAGFVAVLHGVIHIMGFVAYWPLAKLAELPYKTAVLGGRWEIGPMGMRLFGLLWLVAALGFLVATVAMLMHLGWWRTAMISSIVLSSLVIALDWAPAFRGSIANLLLLVVVALATWVPRLWPDR